MHKHHNSPSKQRVFFDFRYGPFGKTHWTAVWNSRHNFQHENIGSSCTSCFWTFSRFFTCIFVKHTLPQPGNSTESHSRAGVIASIVEFCCGSCKEEVSDSHAAVECDSCLQWYHAHCQNISTSQYAVYASLESFSWLSELWFSPNYSSGRVGSLSSLPVSNHYSVLQPADSMDDLTSPITTPKDASVPLSPQSNGFSPAANDSRIPSTSTPIKSVEQTKTPNVHQFSKLKVMCINCKSIQSTEKRSGFYAFLDYHQPDIVVETESWLHKDIPDCVVFPSFLGYNPPIRRDRPSDTKGDGVFILVSQRLVVSEQPQLSTDCKIVWPKSKWSGQNPSLLLNTIIPQSVTRWVQKNSKILWHWLTHQNQLPKIKLGGKSAHSQKKLSKPWNVSRLCFCSGWQRSHPNDM